MACTSCQSTSPYVTSSASTDSGYSALSDHSLGAYLSGLRAKICPKCTTFWIVLAIIVLAIYAHNRRG
jgi:hypothetical protein